MINVPTYVYRNTGAMLNPAIGLGLMIISLDFNYVLPYCACSFAGGVAALLFHEIVFVRTMVLFEPEEEEPRKESRSETLDRDVDFAIM